MVDGTAVKEIERLAKAAAGEDVVVELADGSQRSTVTLHDTRLKEAEPETLVVHTLTGIRDYVENNGDALTLEQCVLHVAGPTEVHLRSKLTGEFLQRFTYVKATAHNRMAGFRFGEYLGTEDMQISLQALFEPVGARGDVLQLLGTILNEEGVRTEDDGVTQKVTVKAGVSFADNVRVPNPVHLAPYRTFPELEQPESPFILRVKKGPGGVLAALFEADGGAWRNEAIEAIRTWLAEEVSDVPIIA